MKERLQKIMAQAGLGSRRDNEETILAGRVRVNGKIAKLGDKADPAVDRIEVDGKRLNLKGKEPVYIAVNKPKGVLSSLEDELGENRRTVRDLINVSGHLYPVGRLDKQSGGLMLMTNDGDLAHRLTHPRYGHEKSYRVTVEGNPNPAVLEQWEQGVLLDGRMTAPARVEVIRQQRDQTVLRVVMREGRKRQIRRVASLLGHPVSQLIREAIGPLKLGNLKPGQWRYLAGPEIAELKRAVQRTKRKPRPAKDEGRREAAKASYPKVAAGQKRSGDGNRGNPKSRGRES